MAVRQLEDAVTQEQLQHRQFFHPFEAEADTGLPAFAVPAAAYRMSASPARITRRPPRMGQHTDGVLREHGYTQEDIGRLRAAGII